MKKLLSLCLALLLAGCSAAPAVPSSASVSVPPVSTPSSSEAAPVSASEVSESSADGGVDVKEGFDTVTITVPLSMLGDISTFDGEKYAQELGFISAEIQADKAVIVTMSKTRHNELIKEMRQQLSTQLEELTTDPETPYIKKIMTNSDFTQVTILVEKEGYQSTFDMTPMTVVFTVGFYQLFEGAESKVHILVKDETTEEVLYDEAFPDESK